MKSVTLLAVALLAFTLQGQIPNPVLPEGVGVNIHFVTGRERDLDLIAAAGFKFVRMDFGWGGIERKRGEYDWSGYDELTANLEKRGLRALYILDYSNGLYEEEVASPNPISGKTHKTTASPQHPESVAAFARWAAAAATHFRGRKIIWEIWNEPNIQFWQPKPNVEQYTALALASCKAIRDADPQATIIAPATSEFPWSFLEACFQSGLLAYVNGVSVHPYRNPGKPPETAAADFARLRALIDRYAPARLQPLPILSGEWGYSSHLKGVTLETQAAFAVRQQLSNLLNGVPLSIWYDWQNDGNDPKENEHNFGTVFPDLKPKPAYLAIQALNRELGGYAIESRLGLAIAADYALVLTNRMGTRKLAAWTVGKPHAAKLSLPAGGELSVELSAAPLYLPLPRH